MKHKAQKYYESARTIIASKRSSKITDTHIKQLLLHYDDSDSAFRVIMDTLELLGEQFPSKSICWMWQLQLHGYGHENELRAKIPQMLDKASSYSPVRGATYATSIINESKPGSFYNKMAQKQLLSNIFNIAVQSNDTNYAQSILGNCLKKIQPKQRQLLSNDATSLFLNIELHKIGIKPYKL